ncbi:MAG TPA: cation-translocating P-type ATPase C-terminal domain-containing protein, partial [Clostridia bacterium]|nr:cation-translocating P-type ATPase C-terminal domain-containing protein [Clostridia bacterium]
AFVSVYSYSMNLQTARTAAFLTLVGVQLIHVFECKSESKNLFQINLFNNFYLIASCIVSFLITLAAVYIPALQPVFGTTSLNLKEIIWVVLYSLIGPVLSIPFVHGKNRRRV